MSRSQNSAAGNWTRVFRVTGGNTHHYTTADAGDQQIDKSYSLNDFSLHALRLSITGNHWSRLSQFIYIYPRLAHLFLLASIALAFLMPHMASCGEPARPAMRNTLDVIATYKESPDVCTNNKRPAWPQQPNLYLEPKWLRCWMISHHWTHIDAHIQRGHSSPQSQFRFETELEIDSRENWLSNSRENARFSRECPILARMRK